jgi:phytol kinase
MRGPLAYVLVMLAVVLCAWRQHPAGAVAIAMMCGGDGLADVAGSRWGKARPLPWNAHKSWPGSVAMLLGAFCSAVG